VSQDRHTVITNAKQCIDYMSRHAQHSWVMRFLFIICSYVLCYREQASKLCWNVVLKSVN